MANTKTINVLPSPTWRWLSVNKVEIEEVGFSGDFGLKGEIVISEGQKLDSEILSVSLDKENLSQNIKIHCNKDSRATFILDYTSKGEGVRGEIIVESLIEEGAELTLVEVQRMDKRDSLVSSIKSQILDSGKLDVLQVFLGGKDAYTEINCALKGDRSAFSLQSAYSLYDGQNLDINYVVDHFGKNTECSLKSQGVLYKGAKKTYRGTIDFKRGAKGAVGNETEDVLLMDEDVVNKTVPIILCAEEDVEGNHGATIGRIGEELLFYMMSRGLSEDAIYDMLAKGRMESVIRQIPNQILREDLL